MNEEKDCPFVSVCTPTFNRRPFIKNLFSCFQNQTYPKNRIEWIIVDDGTDKIKDLVEKSGIKQIKYFPLKNKVKLGKKRNFMHSKTKGDILVYMDDDDYYPPDRIEHAVETLLNNPHALCAGSSELYVYFKDLGKMYQSGPYGKTHSTAGTFAMRKQLLEITSYDDSAALAEERHFLKGYTIPFVQLNPMKTILVFSHNHNSFDKKNMLTQGDKNYFKESTKKVENFIKFPYEKDIYDFFMEHIDKKLEQYEPGKPENKPDVLKQIKEMDEERKQMLTNHNGTGGVSIIIETPEGKRPMNPHEIVQVLSTQQQQIKQLVGRVQELEAILTKTKEFIVDKF
jgi:glycosyltransferase involved in cell wall biosynthesis